MKKLDRLYYVSLVFLFSTVPLIAIGIVLETIIISYLGLISMFIGIIIGIEYDRKERMSLERRRK